MPDLTYRQEKIQDKRKQTPFRDFVMEIASRYGYAFYKNAGTTSRFSPYQTRIPIHPRSVYDETDHTKTRGEWSGNFFADIQILFSQIGIPSNFLVGSENATHADNIGWSKNVYLSTSVGASENVLYSSYIKTQCTDVLNSLWIIKNCNVVYQSVGVIQSSCIFFSKGITNSSFLYHCRDCIGCHHCIQCSGLRNQAYCINNKVVGKEYFETYFRTYKLDNVTPMNFSYSYVENSENVENTYFIGDVKNGRNVLFSGGSGSENIELYDVMGGGAKPMQYVVASMTATGGTHCYCCYNSVGGNTTYYSYFLENCDYCLGCIGLKNKSYCIFNKQYTKEERHEKVNEIFTQMEKDGTLGQFFPPTMNPFYFNDTAAYLIDPTFTKEEVEKAGYLRRDEPIKVDIPAGLEQVNVRDLDQYEGYDANGKRTIDEAILKKVIIDDEGNCRRVVRMEYDFLVKYALPLPRKHRLERMKENFRIG